MGAVSEALFLASMALVPGIISTRVKLSGLRGSILVILDCFSMFFIFEKADGNIQIRSYLEPHRRNQPQTNFNLYYSDPLSKGSPIRP